MKFVLEIDCGNAAFGEHEADCSLEVARIVRDVADKLEVTPVWGRGAVTLRDINGNAVGTARFEEVA